MDSDRYSCIGNACNGYSVAILAGKSSITGSQDDDVNRERRVAGAAPSAATATHLPRFLKSRLLHHTAQSPHSTHAPHATHTITPFLLRPIDAYSICSVQHTA